MRVRGQVRGGDERSFAAPSPGQILRQAPRAPASTGADAEHKAGGVELRRDPFRPDIHIAALMERGVLLAPLVVQWHYKVAAARPFASCAP